MKKFETSGIRNIAILGSSGAGKTTFAEAMLFECGLIKRMGTIDNQNTVSDYFPVEKDYGYSVISTIVSYEWKNKKMNFIDCPGADDFVGNAVSALNMADMGLMLIDAHRGVQVGTINQFRLTEKLAKPVVFLLNGLDHEKADYENTLSNLKEIYGSKVIPIQYPVSISGAFDAVVDVLKQKMYKWVSPDATTPEILPIPDSENERAEQYFKVLLEAAAENDEDLMEKYFDQGTLSEEDMRDGIHKGLLTRDIFPVMVASSTQNRCVHRTMNFLSMVAPSPLDVLNPIDNQGNEIAPDSSAETRLFVFKTTVEPHIGEVSYFKVMSGELKEGDDLQNADRSGKERIAQIFSVAGQLRENVSIICAGDIGATVKMKDVRTGNTLNEKGVETKFDFIKYPDPKYRRAISAVSEADEEKLSEILTRMHEEDPTWIIEQSKELKQTILSGQGEFHLRTLKWRVENNDKINIQFAEPKIPYRETITKIARADYRHKKQSGGAGQFGEVHLIVEPYEEGMPNPEMVRVGGQEIKVSVRDIQEIQLEWGGKLVLINSIVGGAIDTRFIPAIMKGLMDRMEQGPLTGSYARDVRVIVYDGKMHPVDSNEISFRLAGRNAFATAFKNAAPKILEPVYDVEVLVPSDKMGDVMSDLQGRRALIMGMNSDKGFEKLIAKVPLKEMGTYATSLSSLTGGRASFSMKFASYELVPSDVQEKLLKVYQAQQDEQD